MNHELVIKKEDNWVTAIASMPINTVILVKITVNYIALAQIKNCEYGNTSMTQEH